MFTISLLFVAASIIFSYSEGQPTSGVCLSSSLDSLPCTTQGSKRGLGSDQDAFYETRLIPEMMFTCDGILTELIVTGRISNGTMYPKVQLWREIDIDQSYTKIAEFQIDEEWSAACESITVLELPGCDPNFHCLLSPLYQVDVHPGDIIGVELPHLDDQGFELYFIDGFQTHYVWRGQVRSPTLSLYDAEFSMADELLLSVNVNIIQVNISSVLLPFGTSAGDTLGPFFDDSSSNVIYLKEVFKFAGREYSNIIVNSNGVLSFGDTPFVDFRSRAFPIISPPLIAPFWYDLDPSAGGSISYRVSNDSELLSSFNSLWEQLNVRDLINFMPTNLFIATWYQVPVFGSDPFQIGVGRNSFQVVLATDTVKTVALFIYDDINDGSGAQVGFNIGDGYSSYSLPGALSNQTLLLDDNSNSGKTGFYIFRLDNITTVQCSTTVDCAISDLGTMTPRDCCVGTQSSLAYTVPGSAECHPCVVFGWYNDSFTGVEQEDAYTLQIGYQKGAVQLGQNLGFTITVGSSAGPRVDLTVADSTVRISPLNLVSTDIEVIFVNDAIALESNETATLQLVPVGTISALADEGVFFRSEININIIDSDVLDLYLLEDDYRVFEASPVVHLQVCKNLQIAEGAYAEVVVSTDTVGNASISGLYLSDLIPPDNPYSPNRADSMDVLNINDKQILLFASDESSTVLSGFCSTATITIIDDNVNEAFEQYFIVKITLPTYLEDQNITLSRSVSIVRIIDDDRISFGFEQENYAFIEPPFDAEQRISLVAEDDRLSEQTFTVIFELSLSLNYPQASLGLDFLADIDPVSYHIIFPGTNRIYHYFYLISDNITESIEAFSVNSTAISDGQFPIYSPPSNLPLQTTVLIIDSENSVGFSEHVSNVRESDGVVQITIFAFSSVDNLTIHFTTHDAGAAEGLDYEGFFQRPVDFGGNDSTIIEVSINEDELAEGEELFYGELTVNGPTEAFTATIYISISDNEVVGICGNLVRGKNCSENALCTVSSDGVSILGCDCIGGYHGSGFICQDVDECANGLDILCDQNSRCTNTVGSYECNCENGYIGDGVSICVNATNQVDGPCEAEDNCTCSTSFGCACDPGFEKVVGENETARCQDVNECERNLASCNGTCVNEVGSFKCYCPVGYTLNSTIQICIDVDECTLGNNLCSSNADCLNTPGSYECVCKKNFYGDGINCRSAEECERGTETNQCGCFTGFYFEPLTGDCEDIDECTHNPLVCHKTATCTNTEGSYHCNCSKEFQGNGHICNDIDECHFGTHDCDENAECTNTFGGFTCTCKTSYFGDGKECEGGISPEIATPTTPPIRPNHELSYVIGSNICLEDDNSFPRGITVQCPLVIEPLPPPEYTITATKLSNDSIREELVRTASDTIFLDRATLAALFDNNTSRVIVTCRVENSFGNDENTTIIRVCDLTECQDGVTNNCSQLCTRNGSNEYECSCIMGYELEMDECLDINECANASTNNCSEVEHEMCRNVNGSYECDCTSGFNRDEGTCQDIDECATMTDNDCGKFEECQNEPLGSFTCLCITGYYRSGQQCLDINECANSSLNDCLESNNQVCVNVPPGSYTCQCMDGFEEDDNMICQDIDECNIIDLENGNCSQICYNTPGSYSCECYIGYYLDEFDNSTCHDIDECRIGTDNCHTNANCENTLGSFVCRCKSLYEDDGVNCVVSESVIIGSILGSVSFFLIGGIVLASILLFYCFRRASQKRVRYLAPLDTDENDSKGNMQERLLSVQSSYKLKLPPHLIITSSTLKLVETIGQGEFGIVYKGYIVRNPGSGDEVVTSIVAIKTLKGFYDSAAVREMLKESAEMYKFDHPNVLTLTGVCLDGGPAPFIIMPFMTNGSLLSYLKKNRASLVVFSNDSEEEELESVQKQLLDMCIQVARGMEYLAMMKVVHRDLAARNCMIDMNFVIKVADFGLAESVGTKDYFRQDKETVVKLPLKWLAPESMEDYVFSEKSDVWAYGVTCWEICSGGKVPYPSVDLMKLPTLLADGHRLNKPKNDACSDDMYMAMMNCWEYEPDKRPSFSSLVVSLSQYLESMAEYMDMGTSLSKALEANEVEVKTESNDSTKGEGKKVDVPEVIVSTLESTL